MVSCSNSTVLWASHLRPIHPQLKWANCTTGAAQPLRGKTPKTIVLQPRVNVLGLKNLSLLAIAMSKARKATKPQSAGNGVNYSLCLYLQAKATLEITNQFPNRETDFAKEYL